MRTFHLPHPDNVLVESTTELTKEQLLTFPAFNTWLSTLQHSLDLQSRDRNHPFHESPYVLRRITVQSVDRFGGDRLGFVKLRAEISNDQGEKLPGSVFLRGGSVAMMTLTGSRPAQIILQPEDCRADTEDEKHLVLAVQARVPAGSLSMVELPAGMIDDSGTFAGAAAREIQEEIGVAIDASELTDMTKLALALTPDSPGEKLQQGVYPSPGGSDEFIPIFLHRRRVPRTQLHEWQGRLTGLRSSGEKITLRLVPLQDAWKAGARDAKVLSACALYEGLRREGKI